MDIDYMQVIINYIELMERKLYAQDISEDEYFKYLRILNEWAANNFDD